MNTNGGAVLKQIETEIDNYMNGTFKICDGYEFSPAKLIRRIMLYKNCVYPTGKFDSQGNYKYWFDIITPRVNAEIKNIDFDTKDILLFSDSKSDTGRLFIANSQVKSYFRKSGEAEKLNEAVERGTEWGNVVWKKVKGGYEILELNRFMVLNPIAQSLEDSDVIEEQVMYSADLRSKTGIWDNVEDLIKSNKPKEGKSSPEFYIYERNGEITEKDYYEAMGEQKGSDEKYMLCKVIVGGCEPFKPEKILYCDVLTKKPYKEYHRSKYSNRWIRVGMYETLFDVQTRCNEIGNQIARGLEWASKTIFRSSDRVIAQNILTDLQNGDIIKSTDLQQVNTRMDGLDQLVADWNQQMKIADQLANSYEVVTGESSPSGTPFRLAAQQNLNANKLFDFIREKLGIAFGDVVEEWILPGLIKDLKAKDVIRLTNDEGMLARYYKMVVDDWYLQNLLSFPPHSPEQADAIKLEKFTELMQNKQALVDLEKGMWGNFLPRVIIDITGENYDLIREMESLKAFIALEGDPVRRTALIEMAMGKQGIDVETLPKTPPMPAMPQGAQPQQQPATGRQAVTQ